jgi:NADH-quinone oxidoreductase subunit J
MSASVIIFYCIAAFILAAAVLSVTTTRIFRSAIWLLFCLMGVGALYFWMDLQFIAAVQIIVYVGGIVVLIIFSIFLTQQSGKKMPAPAGGKSLYALLATLFGIGLTASLIYQHHFTASEPPAAFTADVAQVGEQMLSTTEHGYVLPFEVISVLLLAAMIGCIVIAMKEPAHKKDKPELK